MLTISINPSKVTPHEDHLHIFTDHPSHLIALQLMLFFFKKERYTQELIFEINPHHSLPESHAIVKLFFEMRQASGQYFPGTFEQMQQAGFYLNINNSFYEQIRRHLKESYLA